MGLQGKRVNHLELCVSYPQKKLDACRTIIERVMRVLIVFHSLINELKVNEFFEQLFDLSRENVLSNKCSG